LGITGSIVNSYSILLSNNTICHLLPKATVNTLLMIDLLLIKVIFNNFFCAGNLIPASPFNQASKEGQVRPARFTKFGSFLHTSVEPTQILTL